MRKNLQPEEICRMVHKLAYKNKLSAQAYVVRRGLSSTFLTHLKKDKRDGITLNAALKLGIVEVIKV